MFPLMNDTTDYLSDQLRGQIERTGIFDLRETESAIIPLMDKW
jgi:hypothetical protein